MCEETPNKALAIIKTAILASIVCAVCIGGFHTFKNGLSITEFFTITYLAFINKLIMPVGVATLVNYIVIKKKFRNRGIVSHILKFFTLSVIAFAFLFIWNALEVVFQWENIIDLDRFTSNIMDELMIGVVLCTPVAFMVMVVYTLFKPRA